MVGNGDKIQHETVRDMANEPLMVLTNLVQKAKKDREVKKASIKINKIRKEMNKMFDTWRENGIVDDLVKAQTLQSELKQVMTQSLESLAVSEETRPTSDYTWR